jgi:hypothetical protein
MKIAPIKDHDPGANGCGAFTLMEAVIAGAVAAVMFASVYLGLGQGFAIIQSARENLRATQILQEKMETIRLYTWDQISSNGFIPTTFTAPFNAASTQSSGGLVYSGTLTISPAPMTESYAADHKLVTVVLTWPSGGMQHQRQTSTFVSRYGMHNYYY